MPLVYDYKQSFSTLAPHLDVQKHLDLSEIIGDDQFTKDGAGRTTTIANLILEGGLTFEGSVYDVALFVSEPSMKRAFFDLMKILKNETEAFSDEYFHVVKTQDDILKVYDWDDNLRITVKMFDLSMINLVHLQGRRFDNFFFDIPVNSRLALRVFDISKEMPRFLKI